MENGNHDEDRPAYPVHRNEDGERETRMIAPARNEVKCAERRHGGEEGNEPQDEEQIGHGLQAKGSDPEAEQHDDTPILERRMQLTAPAERGLSRHPAAVYIAGLGSEASQDSVQSALNTVARLLGKRRRENDTVGGAAIRPHAGPARPAEPRVRGVDGEQDAGRRTRRAAMRMAPPTDERPRVRAGHRHRQRARKHAPGRPNTRRMGDPRAVHELQRERQRDRRARRRDAEPAARLRAAARGGINRRLRRP